MYSYTWLFKCHLTAIKLYIIHKWTVIYSPVAWVQLSTKCLSEVFRIARFCTNFLNFSGGGPPDPPPTLPGISKGMF